MTLNGEGSGAGDTETPRKSEEATVNQTLLEIAEKIKPDPRQDRQAGRVGAWQKNGPSAAGASRTRMPLYGVNFFELDTKIFRNPEREPPSNCELT
jgi:hypothetical protein